MLPADGALVRAQQPTLEERGDPVDTREHGFGGLAAAEQDPPVMAIADLGESAVALQTVRDHDGARGDGLLDERQQAGRRGVRDPAQANPTDGRAAHLRSDSHQGLLADVATPTTGLDAAHERFVHFHRAGQAVPAGAHHGAAQLVEPGPGGAVAAEPQDTLQAQRAGPGLLADHPPDRAEPQRQRRAGVLEDRSRRHGHLMPARRAHPEPASGRPRLRGAARRAREVPRPPKLRQVLAARLVGGEPPLQLHGRARVILHDPHYYRLRSLESREYPQSALDVTPQSLTFTQIVGQPTPPAQTVTVTASAGQVWSTHDAMGFADVTGLPFIGSDGVTGT